MHLHFKDLQIYCQTPTPWTERSSLHLHISALELKEFLTRKQTKLFDFGVAGDENVAEILSVDLSLSSLLILVKFQNSKSVIKREKSFVTGVYRDV